MKLQRLNMFTGKIFRKRNQWMEENGGKIFFKITLVNYTLDRRIVRKFIYHLIASGVCVPTCHLEILKE